jgi:hypothetical protein
MQLNIPSTYPFACRRKLVGDCAEIKGKKLNKFL